MEVISPEGIGNMTLSLLGNFGTISNLTTPKDSKELALATWYDTCRQFVLKLLMPNFALGRAIVAQLGTTPAFGYAYEYQFPSVALKILGVGNAKDKENNYAVEAGVILHDYDYTDGMPVRFVRDITDISKWSPEAKILFAQYLAAYSCLQITQDVSKAAKLKSELPAEISSASGLNAQENMPVRISRSRFKASRYVNSPTNTDKK